MRLKATRLTSISKGKSLITIGVNPFNNTAAAYSLRIPAGSSYNGSLIRVRRSSDNAELNFSAVATADINGDRLLDTSAISAWLTTNSGFITTWYDQSGNGRNATQTTAANQPRIYNAGAFETENGRTAINFIAGTQLLSAVDPLNGNNDSNATFNWVGTSTIGRGQDGFGAGWSFANFAVVFTANGIAGYTYPAPVSGDSRLTTVVINQDVSTSSAQKFWSGSAGTSLQINNKTFRSSTVGLTIGDHNGTTVIGTMLEAAIFPIALSNTVRLSVERSQGAAYGINII
jgi:hypothetical protein